MSMADSFRRPEQAALGAGLARKSVPPPVARPAVTAPVVAAPVAAVPPVAVPPVAVPPVAVPPVARGQRLAPDVAIVYLSAQVHRRLNRYCAGHRKGQHKPSFTAVLFDAIEQSVDQLGGWFAPGEPDTDQKPVLFARREPLRRSLPAPQVQVTLRPGERNVEVLDRLAAEHARSRSEFVETVLDRWLPGGPKA